MRIASQYNRFGGNTKRGHDLDRARKVSNLSSLDLVSRTDQTDGGDKATHQDLCNVRETVIGRFFEKGDSGVLVKVSPEDLAFAK